VSKIICSAAIRGAHKIVERAERDYEEALERWGPNEPVGFPNTAYYLPVIYAILGIPVEKVGDMKPVLERCRVLLPPMVKEKTPLPYLAPALDAGMATFFAEEIIEAIRYLKDPDFYTKQDGWGRRMMSSFESAASSSWMGRPPGLRPSPVPPQVPKSPRGSPRSCRRRTCMCSCARSTREGGSASNW